MIKPKKCPKCFEVIFTVQILRFTTSDKAITQSAINFKYCPFCGERLSDERQETI